MALFKVRRVKVNKRGYFVPASKRELYYTSMDPSIRKGMVTPMPEFGPKDYFEILEDYSDGKCRERKNKAPSSWCMRWWPK